MILAHWALLVSGWELDRLGPVDALRILRTHIPTCLRAFNGSYSLFNTFFEWLRADIDCSPRLSKRRKVPLSFQLWYALEESFVYP